MATAAARNVGHGWAVAGVGMLTVVLVDGIRAWLPSVVQVAGDLGTTSPLWYGAVAAIAVVVPLPFAAAMDRLPPRTVWWAATLATVAARAVLQTTDGGVPQLVLATLVVICGLVALVAVSAGAPSGHLARLGFMVGLAASTILHVALGTRHLLWRDGFGTLVVVAALLLATAVAANRAQRLPLWWPTDRNGALAPVWTRGPAWPWLAIGPAIFLMGVVVGTPAEIELVAGWSPGAADAMVVVAAGVGVLAAMLGPSLGTSVAGTAGAGVVLVGVTASLLLTGVAAAFAQLAVAAGLGLVLGAAGDTPGDTGPRRRGMATAASALLFAVLAFAYYSSYDLRLPFSNAIVVLGTAFVVAAIGGTSAIVGRRLAARQVPLGSTVATVTLVAVLAVVVAVVAPEAPVPRTGDGSSIRIATYNVAGGFDAQGRYVPEELAAAVRRMDVDVVVLQEVDRGWMLGGGQDLLRILASELDAPAVFAPAADPLWGNAVISRLPIRDVTVQALPRGGTPMRRSLVSFVVDTGPESAVAVVGTHLHHVPRDVNVRLQQSRAVAAEAARLRARGLPVVVLGDLNAQPGDPELEPLMFLQDAVPGGEPTWPAHDPRLRIDHLLVTPDLAVTDRAVPAIVVSDHLPVVAEIQPR